MALKPNRVQPPYGDVIDYIFSATAERGGVASVSTAASTGYPGDPANVAAYASDPTIVTAIGILLQDVVSLDTNRVHDNFYKAGFQQRVGQKVNLNKAGRYHTNMIPNGVTIVAPQPAFLAANGLISNVQATSNGGTDKAPQVGTWVTNQDADGFAVVDLDQK